MPSGAVGRPASPAPPFATPAPLSPHSKSVLYHKEGSPFRRCGGKTGGNARKDFDHMETLETYRGVTLRGLPVRLELQWPFHPSEGGSDWHVAHGRLWLADGGELHADIALNLSQSINEVLPSRDGDLAFAVALNTARKALDDRQLQLLKSGKRQPVPVSSRCYNLRRQQFTFWHVKPEELEEFVARKVFWAGGPERSPVLIACPADALYLDAADPQMKEKLLAAAQKLADRGLLELLGDSARAADALVRRAEEFHAAKEKALDELHAKHAYERS